MNRQDLVALWEVQRERRDSARGVPLPVAPFVTVGVGESAGASSPACPCYDCATDERRQRMVLCETCGNKRCPHATSHAIVAVVAFALGLAAPIIVDNVRSLPEAWSRAPDENLRPWFRTVRRALGGGPR